jgi:hypothetical protein
MEAGRGTARERREDGADDHISAQRGSKVFELLEGGAAARKAGRRKVNVFARWAASPRRPFGFALLPMLHTPAVRYLDQLSMKLGSS